jgi:hypothetical protein
MPTQQQMNGMRQRYRERLPRTCTVPGVRTGAVNQGDGTTVETFSASTPNVRCSFRSSSGNVPIVESSKTPLYSHVLRFEHGIVLQSGMVITINATADEPARTFQLVAPREHVFMVGQEWTANEYGS